METKAVNTFTEGKILSPLIRFALPILAAMFLQSLYGAIDLLVVGRFASEANISAVATGSQIMFTLTSVVTSLAMGTTIVLGHQIGAGEAKEGGKTVGTSIAFFAVVGVAASVAIAVLASQIAAIMNAPAEAFDLTVSYLRICGGGSIIILAYNLIGSIFRGIGDSRTPLYAVIIACILNIAGDLIFVAGFHMGAQGAAIATVVSQLVSVILSLLLIRKKKLPFEFRANMIRFNGSIIRRIVSLGAPIMLSTLLIDLSFLITFSVVNNLGMLFSAGVGVAEKVTSFIMLVPMAFMQSMAAFTAQNYGAAKTKRAVRALWYAIGFALVITIILFFITFFRGDALAGIFTNKEAVIPYSFDYLRAFAIDAPLTAIFFCFTGFFNGIGMTKFTMIQGLIGAFCVRVPVTIFMSTLIPPSLFQIGLATPLSSVVQIILNLICFAVVMKKMRDGTFPSPKLQK